MAQRFEYVIQFQNEDGSQRWYAGPYHDAPGIALSLLGADKYESMEAALRALTLGYGPSMQKMGSVLRLRVNDEERQR